jgi:hypothetical protein
MPMETKFHFNHQVIQFSGRFSIPNNGKGGAFQGDGVNIVYPTVHIKEKPQG